MCGEQLAKTTSASTLITLQNEIINNMQYHMGFGIVV